jgi:archaellum biogenesis ATPase FlaH
VSDLFKDCQALAWKTKLSKKLISPDLNLGIPLLDLGSGGIAPTNRIVIQGASESGKTTLATTLAYNLEKQGCSVLFLAHDQDPIAIWARFTQLAGTSRGALVKDPNCLSYYNSKQLAVAGSDVSIESAIETLKETDNKYKVLIVDSIQSCYNSNYFTEIRNRVDYVLDTISAASSTGFITIALSTVSRAGAKGIIASENAAKESGNIIHHSDLLLDMKKLSQAVSKLSIIKNRLGVLHGADSSRFYAACDLELDPDTSEAREIFGGLANTKKQYLREKILDVLTTPMLKREICASVKGRTKNINDEVNIMLSEGTLVLIEDKVTKV